MQLIFNGYQIYDVRILQYRELLEEFRRGQLREIIKLTTISGAEIVQKELDELNKRFSQLSSIILERRNILQVLMQNYKNKRVRFYELQLFCLTKLHQLNIVYNICSLFLLHDCLDKIIIVVNFYRLL